VDVQPPCGMSEMSGRSETMQAPQVSFKCRCCEPRPAEAGNTFCQTGADVRVRGGLPAAGGAARDPRLGRKCVLGAASRSGRRCCGPVEVQEAGRLLAAGPRRRAALRGDELESAGRCCSAGRPRLSAVGGALDKQVRPAAGEHTGLTRTGKVDALVGRAARTQVAHWSACASLVAVARSRLSREPKLRSLSSTSARCFPRCPFPGGPAEVAHPDHVIEFGVRRLAVMPAAMGTHRAAGERHLLVETRKSHPQQWPGAHGGQCAEESPQTGEAAAPPVYRPPMRTERAGGSAGRLKSPGDEGGKMPGAAKPGRPKRIRSGARPASSSRMPVGQSDTMLMEQQQQQQPFYPQQNGFADVDPAAAAAGGCCGCCGGGRRTSGRDAALREAAGSRRCRVDEGDFAHMELPPASRRGDGSVQAEWFKDGRPLTGGLAVLQQLRPAACVLLDILYTHPEDSGQYVCVARNRWGSEQSQPLQLTSTRRRWAELDQQLQAANRQPKYGGSDGRSSAIAAAVCAALANVSVQEGQPAHFETSVTPSADSTMQAEWLRTAPRPCSSGGYAALEILYCRPEDSGRYTCVATNRLGRAESQRRRGSSCTGSVGVVTTSNLSEASVMNMSPTRRVRRGIQTPERAAAGAGPAQVPVRDQPAPAGGEGELAATFEVQVAPGSGNRIELAWFKDGQQLQTGSRINSRLEMGVASLDIYYAYAEDSGTYSAVVSSEFGQDQSAPAQLSCLPEHGVSAAAPLPEVKENDQVYMDLQVEPVGDGNIRVDWFRNGQPLNYGSPGGAWPRCTPAALLPGGQRRVLGGGQQQGRQRGEQTESASSATPATPVVTQSQLPGDSQGYKKLRRSREAPVTEADYQFFSQPQEPQSTPQFDVVPEANTVCEGYTARFLVKLSGNPRPRVSWYINDLMIAQDEPGETRVEGGGPQPAWRGGRRVHPDENNFKRLLDLRKVQRSDELETKIGKPKASIIEFRKVERESEIKSRLFQGPRGRAGRDDVPEHTGRAQSGHYAGLMEVQEASLSQQFAPPQAFAPGQQPPGLPSQPRSSSPGRPSFAPGQQASAAVRPRPASAPQFAQASLSSSSPQASLSS
uniref:Ig-like domain-containing protein n=1 Tax=Macrostomum lignano TaxID=282301 RepID=A0A1I8FLC9_9PLAT